MHAVRVLAIVGGRNVALPWSEAVVQVGLCSGVLVSHDAVLTSAHCLEGPVTSIRVADHLMGVATCVRHPGYRAGETKHDIGLCLLKAATDVQPIGLDDGPALLVGASVILAGFGQTGPLARDGGQLRSVATTVTRVPPDALQVGSAEATACRGDSGGPLLVERSDGLRVAAVIHGGTQAICASAAQVVSTYEHRVWLERSLTSSSVPGWVFSAFVLSTASAVLIAWKRSRRAALRAGCGGHFPPPPQVR
jgi:trypsin